MQEELQKKVAEGIKKYEEEKVLEAERLAREEARKKAEAEAKEKARIEEEKRIAEEKRLAEEREKQLAREKAEAEKRAAEEAERQAKLAKKNRPYKWKDVSFVAGAGYTQNLYDDMIKNYYNTRGALSLDFRLKWLPVKTRSNKFGLEFAFTNQIFQKENNFLTASLNSNLFDVKFVWQHKLVGNFFWSVKAGGGLDMFKTEIEYDSSHSSRASPEEKTYFYPAVDGGISLFWIPWKFIVFETGVDFSHVFASSQMGFLMPYACIGFRF